MTAYDIIKRPIITEQSMMEAANKKYTFEVAKDANKIEIAKAVEEEAESISQVTEGIDQISSVVQTNSATAEQSAAASEELSSQAAMLKNLVDNFRLRR